MLPWLLLPPLQVLDTLLDAQRTAAVTVIAMIATTTRKNTPLPVVVTPNVASLVSVKSWKALDLEESPLL